MAMTTTGASHAVSQSPSMYSGACRPAGMFLRQHSLKAGDCIAIKRVYDDSLNIVINPDTNAEGKQVSRPVLHT